LKTAVKHGYRHIDTATLYKNEVPIGEALKECGVPREDMFITTKLWNDNHANVDEAFEKSL